MDYLKLLERSYEIESERRECPPNNKLAYLSESIFDFTTYDSGIDELFASKAIEVCKAINNRTTFDYIKAPDNYMWFLLMCNMPFFDGKLEWGTSIRGAWWGAMKGQIEFQSFGLWIDEEPLATPMKFSIEEWEKFISAIIEFANEET